jgi:hypothetical protein
MIKISINIAGETPLHAGLYYSYGSIESFGNSLPELLANATVDVLNQLGETIVVRKVTEEWMLQLVEAEYLLLTGNNSGNSSGFSLLAYQTH